MAKERTRRTPITGFRNKLTVQGQEPGYQYRIVNDDGDRIRMMEEVGYELVTDKSIKVGDKRVAVPAAEGSPVKVAVGKGENGSPQYAYVMRIKKEWFEEDQKAKQASIDEAEKQMKRNARANADYGKIEIS